MQTTEIVDHTFICARCGKTKVTDAIGAGLGYATRVPGFAYDAKVCYDCCGELDAESLKSMKVGDKTALYWDGKNIINWPGTLKITPIRFYETDHYTPQAFSRIKKTHIWFIFGGNFFYAYQIGGLSQIAHIRRIKMS